MQSKEDYDHTVTKYIHVVTSIKSTASFLLLAVYKKLERRGA
jgi:hypothetical protein